MLRPVNLLLGFIVLAFLIGGASRGDVLSLQLLRPIAVIVLAMGLATLSAEDCRRYRWPLGLALATMVLVIFYLIPLPPSWWQAAPGRELITKIDAAAGIGDIWRPLSVDPPTTWNAFWSLSVPLAALILAVQINRTEQRRLLTAVLIIGTASGLLAIIQTLGDPQGPAYFYRITNNGSAVGLFANRNHQAVFMASLLPLFAAWLATREKKESKDDKKAQRSRINISALIIAAMVLTPLILVTGSRAGMICLILALPLAIWSGGGKSFLGLGGDVYKHGKKVKKASSWKVWLPLIIGLAVIVGVLAAALSTGQSEAVTRFGEASYADDMRGMIAPVLIDLTKLFMPLGSGAGTFVATYKMFEPDSLLMPQYANHAHNDFLEVALTTGILGLLLLAVAGIAILARLRIIGPRIKGAQFHPVARAGFSVILILALASAADYPLRVPSIQALAMLALVWLFTPVWPRDTDRV